MTLSAERPRLILPGLLPADPSLERYRVRPGAVTAVELDPGDVLTVTDTEGRQRGELTVLTGGREDVAALGTAPDTAATALRALARPSPDRCSVCAWSPAPRGHPGWMPASPSGSWTSRAGSAPTSSRSLPSGSRRVPNAGWTPPPRAT